MRDASVTASDIDKRLNMAWTPLFCKHCKTIWNTATSFTSQMVAASSFSRSAPQYGLDPLVLQWLSQCFWRVGAEACVMRRSLRVTSTNASIWPGPPCFVSIARPSGTWRQASRHRWSPRMLSLATRLNMKTLESRLRSHSVLLSTVWRR